MAHTAPRSESGERCDTLLLKINGVLEMSPEVCLILLIYPILLDLQIRPGFQENNPPTDISRSHLYRYPSLSVSLAVTKKQRD